MLFTMHFFESRAYERSAPPPAAVNFHVIQGAKSDHRNILEITTQVSYIKTLLFAV